MELVNHTPFPALAFASCDAQEAQSRVVAVRQTLSFVSGELVYADTQPPLCECDRHFEDDFSASVQSESDLVGYKPKCDVIVNATAYSPAGTPRRRFDLRLQVLKHGGDGKDDIAMLDKSLRVVGERSYGKKLWLIRAVWWVVKWSTLTLIRPSPWKRTGPAKFVSLPLRYEYAFGGACRIDAGDKAARKVRKKYRVSEDAFPVDPALDPALAIRPLAHAVFDFNPSGCGYMQSWYLKAKRQKRVAAPRIEKHGDNITGRIFWQWQKRVGAPRAARKQYVAMQSPAGFGIRSKTHPARAALLGTVDEAFTSSERAMPEDFDNAYFNAAPPDQQLPYLDGAETIVLHNLCPPGTAGLTTTENGDEVLRLTLPQHACFALLRMHDGELEMRGLVIDTVVIEPDTHTLSLVWRLVLPADLVEKVRVCELRMHSQADKAQLRRDIACLERLSERIGNPADVPAVVDVAS